MKIAIIIPAYNESSRIIKVLDELVKYKLPIVVVDDGSADKTGLVLQDIEKKYKGKIAVLTHTVNLGKGAALKTGVDYALNHNFEAVVMMDADGQHAASDLPQFIEILNSQKYDVIFGSRNLGLNVPLVRFLGNKFGSVLVSIMFGIFVSDLLSGYRAFKLKSYPKLKWRSSGYGVETEMVINVAKHKLRYCEIGVETIYLDKFKGVSMIDAIKILLSVIKWRFISD